MTADPHLMTGAYVLDSVDDLERAAFERHLEQCPECRNEVRELRETLAGIAAADASAPRPELRGAVLEAVGQTAQLPPHPAATVGSAGAEPRRSGRLLKALTLAAVAAAAFGLGGLVTHVATAPAPTPVAESQEVAHMVMADDARVAMMTMTPGTKSSVKVVVTPSMGKAAVMTDGLPMPAGSDVYQVWMVEPGGDKHPMNTFRPDDQGRADVMMTGDFDGVAAVELSQEPGGGSPAPTSKPMGTATIAS